jgi:hypothetical protein
MGGWIFPALLRWCIGGAERTEKQKKPATAGFLNWTGRGWKKRLTKREETLTSRTTKEG